MRWSENRELLDVEWGQGCVECVFVRIVVRFPNGQFHQVVCYMIYEYMNISSYILKMAYASTKIKFKRHNQTKSNEIISNSIMKDYHQKNTTHRIEKGVVYGGYIKTWVMLK